MTKRIFISYRTSDCQVIAGRIYDQLARHFGEEVVWQDAFEIGAGDDFEEKILTTLTQSAALIVLMGPGWNDDGAGGRPIDSPGDWPRMEIEEALKRGIEIFPLLVAGATMPTADALPTSLAPFAKRQARSLRSDPYFRHDLESFIRELASKLGYSRGIGRLVATVALVVVGAAMLFSQRERIWPSQDTSVLGKPEEGGTPLIVEPPDGTPQGDPDVTERPLESDIETQEDEQRDSGSTATSTLDSDSSVTAHPVAPTPAPRAVPEPPLPAGVWRGDGEVRHDTIELEIIMETSVRSEGVSVRIRGKIASHPVFTVEGTLTEAGAGSFLLSDSTDHGELPRLANPRLEHAGDASGGQPRVRLSGQFEYRDKDRNHRSRAFEATLELDS